MEISAPHACVLAGPSGVGKGTVVKELLARSGQLRLSVSATTRPPRPGERDGIDYHFISEEEFDHLIASGQMLEWALVHGRYRYGTPRAELDADPKKIVILEVDLAGARSIRSLMPEIPQIFLCPPSWQQLEERLRGRGTENEDQIQARLNTARAELAAQEEFDVIVVNDSVSRATTQILGILGLTK